MVKNQVKRSAFLTLFEKSLANSLKENNLLKLSHFRCLRYLKDTGEVLQRYKKYREIML